MKTSIIWEKTLKRQGTFIELLVRGEHSSKYISFLFLFLCLFSIIWVFYKCLLFRLCSFSPDNFWLLMCLTHLHPMWLLIHLDFKNIYIISCLLLTISTFTTSLFFHPSLHVSVGLIHVYRILFSSFLLWKLYITCLLF